MTEPINTPDPEPARTPEELLKLKDEADQHLLDLLWALKHSGIWTRPLYLVGTDPSEEFEDSFLVFALHGTRAKAAMVTLIAGEEFTITLKETLVQRTSGTEQDNPTDERTTDRPEMDTDSDPR